MPFQLPDDLDGPLLGGAGRQLDLADNEALVLIRQERGGKMQEEEGHGGHNGAVDHPVSPAWCPCAIGLRMVAHSAGVRIMATSTERIMAEMMVMENWR